MIYSIVVWGFDTDNDYQHDCDLIKAKSFKEAFEYTINYMWAGWTFTKIERDNTRKSVHYTISFMITILMKMTF